jgi:methanogenic corrinoid protein MtbC1
VSNRLEDIAEALAKKKSLMAEEITAEYFRRRPEMLARWGEVGKRRCMEDSAFHLSYLAEAVRFDSPELFVDYIGWAKILLHSLRISESDLRENLELVRSTVGRHFEGDDRELVARIISKAEEALPSLPTEVETFLKPDGPLYGLAKNWLELLLAHKTREARTMLINEVKNGTRVPEIYQHVLTPCLQEVGRLWQNRTINEAEEHYCAQATEMVLALLSAYFEGERKRKAVVGFCVSNEQHEIGIRLLMDCFSLHGWDAVSFGSNVPHANIENILLTWKPDVVAISATMTYHLNDVKAAVAAVRRAKVPNAPRILVGGRPFLICADLWKRVGADLSAHSCSEAVVCIDGLE